MLRSEAPALTAFACERVAARVDPQALTGALTSAGAVMPAGTVPDADKSLTVQVGSPVATVDDEAEEDRARDLVRKKLRTMAALDDTTKIRRLVAALARKGYAEGLAYRVVREELRRAGEDTSTLDDLTQD